jgi:hypothetical protein
VERLAGNNALVLSEQELAVAESKNPNGVR